MTRLRFLLLEDNPLDAEVIHLTLTDGGVECELLRVKTHAEFVKVLETNAFNLILADYTLPGFDGISALKIAQKLCPDRTITTTTSSSQKTTASSYI
ncbi:response regulator [Nostoc sp.]|uniref:response regulator n=1 Tax=Nostoc sp. TaxID=1180 RepID=UPI002FF56DA1